MRVAAAFLATALVMFLLAHAPFVLIGIAVVFLLVWAVTQ